MRRSSGGPEGPAKPALNTVAFLNALRFAGWKGVPLRVQHCDGTHYHINAPIIIGDDFVQFASEAGFRPVRVPFCEIAAFELL